MAEVVPSPADWFALLDEARKGGLDALGRLLDAYRGFLTQVAHRELGPSLQSKAGDSDLVQDSLLEAHRDFPHFRGQSAAELQAWLHAILLHKIANFMRHFCGTAKRQVAREVGLDDSGRGAAVGEALVADSTSASGKAVRNEQEAALHQALQRLPPQYQEVLAWRHQEDCSFEEIGRRLDRSADAARMLWHRAVEALRHQLEPTP